jgi:hypothetical protein
MLFGRFRVSVRRLWLLTDGSTMMELREWALSRVIHPQATHGRYRAGNLPAGSILTSVHAFWLALRGHRCLH